MTDRGPAQVRGPNTITDLGNAGLAGTSIIQQNFERPNDVTTNDNRTSGKSRPLMCPQHPAIAFKTLGKLTSHISDCHQGGISWTSADVKIFGLVRCDAPECGQTPAAVDVHAWQAWLDADTEEISLSPIQVDELPGDCSTIRGNAKFPA